MFKFFFVSLFVIVLPCLVFSQDLSNKGTDFWVGYGNHVKMLSNNQTNAQEMVLYVTSTQTTNFKVEIPGAGWSYSGVVYANSVVTTPPIPKNGSQDARLVDEGKYNTGIHITSDKPIVAYAHIYNQNVSGATVLFPTNTLGIEYYSINYTQKSNEANSYSYFFVVATEDETVVEITPSAVTKSGRPAGVPFQTSLKRGEIYNVMSLDDLTGSKIRSISSGNSSCKKVAVFAGTGKIYISCNSGQNTADNIMQQSFPAAAWGKKYITTPTEGMPNNFFRVAVNDPSTTVLVNGQPLSGLINGFYYEFKTSSPQVIESDKPIMVAQYITTQNECGNTIIGSNGDPEMIYISPIEQTIDNITLNSTSNYQITSHYINVILKTNAVASFFIDGQNNTSAFAPHPFDPSFSYAKLRVNPGPHKLKADSGFNAIAYGYGNVESYGYNAGANVIDLYQYITITNKNASTNTPSACDDLPFSIAITLPYQPLKLVWDIPLYPSVTDDNPAYSKTFIKNGKQLYVYELPDSYKYNQEGNYLLKVTVNNPTAEGCSGLQEINFNLRVYPTPSADFYTSVSCFPGPVTFYDTSKIEDRSSLKWIWDFGDNSSSELSQPVHSYNSSGAFNVKLAIMTDVGCVSDTITKAVQINPVPIARFGVSGNFCAKGKVLFSDSSSLYNPARITEWKWEFGDGSAPRYTYGLQNTFYHQYENAGTYIAKLSVKTGQGCLSVVFEKEIIVNDLPKVDFSLPAQLCLPNGLVQFSNLSTITDNSENQFSYKWYFSDSNANGNNPDSSILRNPTHFFSKADVYSIKLVVTSKDGCAADTTKKLKNILEQAKTDFNISAVEICQGNSIVFSDKSDLKGRPLSESFWDFGDGAKSGSLESSHRYSVADTFIVKHYITTSEGCFSDTVTKTIIVHPEPKADFNIIGSGCELKETVFSNASTLNSGAVIKWNWNMGDGTTLTTSNNLSQHTYAKKGGYQVSLEVESNKGCKSNVITKTVEIHPLPKPDFLLPEVCLNDAVAQFSDLSTISDSSENQFTYLWNFGDPNANATNPNTSTDKSGSHKYNVAANYPLLLSVTSKDGCKDTATKILTVNGAVPKADFIINNGNETCNNEIIQIQNSSTIDFGSITRVEIYWDYENKPAEFEVDEETFINKQYKYLYPSILNKTNERKQIKFKVFSGQTCTSEMIKTITINAVPQLEFLPMAGACLSALSEKITEAYVINGLTGSGIFSGKGVNADGVFSPVIAGVGNHTLKYAFISNKGCSAEIEQTKSVWSLPEANYKIADVKCADQPILFQDISVANEGTINRWEWNFQDNSPIDSTSGNNIVHRFAKSGVYNVQLQITTDKGCRSLPRSLPIKINPLPNVEFELPKVCLPDGKGLFKDESTITDGTEDGFTYLWNFGDVNSGAQNFSMNKNPIHYYKGQGPFNVVLQVTSVNGCSAIDSAMLVDVFNRPKADFDATYETCPGNTLDFIDRSEGQGKPIAKWNWNFGDGRKASAQRPAHVYNKAGDYNASLFVVNTEGCVSDTVYKSIKVYSPPVINAGPDLTVTEGRWQTINATALGDQLTYKWEPSLFLNNDTILNPKTNAIDNISYRLIVTGKGGCITTDEVFINVLKLIQAPNTFTPNGDGINDVWEIKNLVKYPNCAVEIYNPQGQLLFKSRGYTKAWDGTYNGKPLPSGTYYYVIDPKDGQTRKAGYVTILR